MNDDEVYHAILLGRDGAHKEVRIRSLTRTSCSTTQHGTYRVVAAVPLSEENKIVPPDGVEDVDLCGGSTRLLSDDGEFGMGVSNLPSETEIFNGRLPKPFRMKLVLAPMLFWLRATLATDGSVVPVNLTVPIFAKVLASLENTSQECGSLQARRRSSSAYLDRFFSPSASPSTVRKCANNKRASIHPHAEEEADNEEAEIEEVEGCDDGEVSCDDDYVDGEEDDGCEPSEDDADTDLGDEEEGGEENEEGDQDGDQDGDTVSTMMDEDD